MKREKILMMASRTMIMIIYHDCRYDVIFHVNHSAVDGGHDHDVRSVAGDF